MPGNYQGVTVTLAASTATAQSIFQLVKDRDAVLNANVPAWDGTCFFLRLQWDSTNTTNAIYVGGSDVSANNYGYAMSSACPTSVYGPLNMNGVPAQSIYVVGSVNSLVLHVEAGCI